MKEFVTIARFLRGTARRLRRGLVVLLLIFTSTGFRGLPIGPTPEPVAISLSCEDFNAQAESKATVSVPAGGVLTVTLCANPTTGFGWEEVQISDLTVLAQIGRIHRDPDSVKLGAPGETAWRFKAQEVGQSTVTFGYSQDWEGGI